MKKVWVGVVVGCIALVLVVCVFWGTVGNFPKKQDAIEDMKESEKEKIALRGQFGDSFGVVNSLIGGLTIVGLAVTISLQVMLMLDGKKEAKTVRAFELFKNWRSEEFQKSLQRVVEDWHDMFHRYFTWNGDWTDYQKREFTNYRESRFKVSIGYQKSISDEIKYVYEFLLSVNTFTQMGMVEKKEIIGLFGKTFGGLLDGSVIHNPDLDNYKIVRESEDEMGKNDESYQLQKTKVYVFEKMLSEYLQSIFNMYKDWGICESKTIETAEAPPTTPPKTLL